MNGFSFLLKKHLAVAALSKIMYLLAYTLLYMNQVVITEAWCSYLLYNLRLSSGVLNGVSMSTSTFLLLHVKTTNRQFCMTLLIDKFA